MTDSRSDPTIVQRLMQALEADTAVELARALGLPVTDVEQALAKGEVPDEWVRICAAETGCNADWIFFGRGPMRLPLVESGAMPACLMLEDVDDDVDMITVPLVVARLSAGSGSLEVSSEQEGGYAFRSDFLHRKGNPREMVLMRVSGDSMEPEIMDNDIVLIDQGKRDVTPGRLYAIGFDEAIYLKRIDILPGKVILKVENMTVASHLHKNNAVKNVSFQVRRGEIVCIAGIDGNGQSELVYAISGLEPASGGTITMCGVDITHAPIRRRSILGMSHIPEDRHKHGLVLDYTLEDNMILQRYFEPEFTDKFGFLRRKNIRAYAERLIEQYDVRSGQGPVTAARSMSGGNQQKAIIAREIDKNPQLLIAVQPTRGLDVGAIEYIHKQIVAQRDAGKAVLLVSLELDEVMSLSDRILVMYEGEIVGELDPAKTTVQELGLYMAGAKRQHNTQEGKGEGSDE